MTEPIDPRIEKLIALLYGELPEEEEEQVRRMIAEDDDLRAEWEEMVSTREFLGEWELEDEAPSFVFLDEHARESEPEAEGFWDRLRGRFGGFATATPWAVAAAAVLIAALAIADFHVERRDGRLAFGFGTPPDGPPSLTEQVTPGGRMLPPDQGEIAPLERAPVQRAGSGEMMLASDQAYISRDEFEAFTAGMTQTMVALINQYGREQNQGMARYFQAALGGLAERQSESYQDLRTRIEALRLGVSEEQFKTNVQVDYLMQQNQPGLAVPVSQSPSEGSGGER
jgi:hypothetical protein